MGRPPRAHGSLGHRSPHPTTPTWTTKLGAAGGSRGGEEEEEEELGHLPLAMFNTCVPPGGHVRISNPPQVSTSYGIWGFGAKALKAPPCVEMEVGTPRRGGQKAPPRWDLSVINVVVASPSFGPSPVSSFPASPFVFNFGGLGKTGGTPTHRDIHPSHRL